MREESEASSCVWIWIFLSIMCWKRGLFLMYAFRVFVESQLAVGTQVYSTLHFTPLVYLPIFTPVTCCLDGYSFLNKITANYG